MVFDELLGLYGLKYDSVIACVLPLYLCSYKLDGSAIGISLCSVYNSTDHSVVVTDHLQIRFVGFC